MNRARKYSRTRRGAVIVWLATALPVMLGIAAICIDMGYFYVIRARLQITAEAAATAGAAQLPTTGLALVTCIRYAEENMATEHHDNVLVPTDVEFGNWNTATRQFTLGGTPLDAVRVTTRRAESNNNPVPYILGGIYGHSMRDISASAVAQTVSNAQGGARFLIDDEMIDTDIMNSNDEKVFEDLAERLDLDNYEDVISDLDGDWFIDLYQHCSADGNCVFELPTGQIGDEALFDVDVEGFPFTESSDPSLTDFLNWNEDGTWRQELFDKELLDPLIHVDTVSDGSVYPQFVDPNFVHVSPVFKSDVNALNPVNGAPAVNALGERRGLLAFKILAVGPDPDGSGSNLPFLVIEVVDPSQIDLDQIGRGSDGTKLVD